MMDDKSRIRRYLASLELEISEHIVDLIFNYEDYVEDVDTDLDAIRLYAEEEGLNTKSRYPDKVNKRAYLYTYIKKSGHRLTLEAIGKIFNRDHASVMHGLKKHIDMTDTKDPSYAESIAKLSKRFVI